MNKLTALFGILLLTLSAQLSFAQISIHKFQDNKNNENPGNELINNTFFVPAGILQSIENDYERPKDEIAISKLNIVNAAMDQSHLIIEKLKSLQLKYAVKLNVEMESLKNLSLLGLLDNWFGTKYKMGGTTKKGIDCSALTSTFLLALYGFTMPRTARQQYKATSHITKDDLMEGDLVFFNTHGGVSHVGLYLANNYFIHASSSQGVTISNLDEKYYSKRFICGGRVEEN